MIELFSRRISLPKAERDSITIAAAAVLNLEGQQGDICVIVCGERRMRLLNRDMRGVDRVTDVLSFPTREGEDGGAADCFLGDIVICLAQAQRQAAEYGNSLSRELAFLSVHGTLHLLGYDHMDSAQEAIMITKQKHIMSALGMP